MIRFLLFMSQGSSHDFLGFLDFAGLALVLYITLQIAVVGIERSGKGLDRTTKTLLPL